MPSHAERKFLPYQPEQLFDLVADVARYPEFLPWCIGARVRRRETNFLVADLIIGFKMFRERFTSEVTLDRPRRIDVKYTEGPLRHLENSWVFEPAPGGCIIDFHVDFAFKSIILEKLIGTVFGEAVRRMVAAFEARAHATLRPVSEGGPAASPA